MEERRRRPLGHSGVWQKDVKSRQGEAQNTPHAAHHLPKIVQDIGSQQLLTKLQTKDQEHGGSQKPALFQRGQTFQEPGMDNAVSNSYGGTICIQVM